MAYGLTIWFSGSSGLTGDSGGKREKEERGSEKEERGSEKGGKRENARETIPEHSELPEKPIHQLPSIQHSAFSI
ncbi:MAG: hypothetical protein IKX30_13910 [Victivallales bacterium]|nr:hypothetical protein [Victivallales bacterium]